MSGIAAYGNLAVAPDNFIIVHVDLSSLTLSKNNTNDQFDIINATSEARAAWCATLLLKRYPNAWPETIRALIVHSSEWTEKMIQQFNIDFSKKTDIENLIKICGYGVPDLDKALNSLSISLIMVCEEEIQPYCKRESGGGYKDKEMHLYKLPCPNRNC